LARTQALGERLDLQKYTSPDAYRILEVEGAWTVVLRVPATRSDEDLTLALVEKKGVYVHRGHFYDFPGDDYLVASLIVPEQDFSNGIARLLELIEGRG
jgi:alanine-synthesizing transaminase